MGLDQFRMLGDTGPACQSTKEATVRVQTVAGPLEPERLGRTLMHEHIQALAPPGFFSGGRGNDGVELAERALGGLRDHGVGALVELTGRGRVETGQVLATLQEISRRTGLALIVGVGLYKAPFAPWISTADVDEVADRLVTMASEASAGILGEVGTSLDEITADEEKCLRAAARAHLRTGLALSTHCTLGTMAAEQVAILAEEAVDLSRIVIGHVDLHPNVDALAAILQLGVTIAFDTFGKEWFDYQVPDSRGSRGREFIKWTYRRSDEDRLDALVQLLSQGWERQIVLSLDISGREAYFNPDTHGRYGYAFLHARVLPALRYAGVSEQTIHAMVVDNPARILSVG